MVYTSIGLSTVRKAELEENLEESLWIEVKHKGESILICNLYRAPNTPVSFWERFNLVLEKALEISKNIIVVGDINEDQLQDRNHHLKDIMYLNSLVNIINEPTTITDNTETLLDPIILPETMSFLNAGVLDILETVSDHRATYVFVPFTYPHEFTFKRMVWLYKKGDFEKLKP